MNQVFVDTSFVVALSLNDDALHKPAVEWNRSAGRDRVTTEYVLVEIADALSAEHCRRKATQVIRGLQASFRVTVVPASDGLFEKGLALFEARRDKSWGLTDCISFVAMKELGVHDALTADHHFEQAGFQALLRLPAPQERE